MANYFKEFLFGIKKIWAKTDQMVFTSDGLKIDGEFEQPDAIYGNSITLPDVLPTQAVDAGATIKAHPDNVSNISVNGMALEPGESVGIEIDSLEKILVTGDALDVAYYLGS